MTRIVVLAVVLSTGCKIANEESCQRPENFGKPECTGGGDAAMVCASNDDCTGADATLCKLSEGVCVGCLTMTDCSDTTPVCNLENACEGCNEHADCESSSNACNFASGACFESDDIAYVRAGATGAGECEQSAPCPSLQAAVDTGKPFIKLEGTTRIDANEKVTIGRDVTLLADPGTAIRSTSGPAIEINNDANVTIQDLEISNNVSGDAILISGNDTAVTLERVFLLNNNGGRGVTATAGKKLVMRGCVVVVNQLGGVSTSDIGIEITNTIVVGNGSGGSAVGGVRVISPDNPASTIFEFNTIANNVTDGNNDVRSGVTCSLEFPMRNNIITGNKLDPICTADHSLFSGVTPPDGLGNMATDDPMFLDTQTGNARMANFFRLDLASPAVDKADSASTVMIDIDGQSRPQGDEKDIGADEVMR